MTLKALMPNAFSPKLSIRMVNEVFLFLSTFKYKNLMNELLNGPEDLKSRANVGGYHINCSIL